MNLRFLNTVPTHKVKAQIHKTGILGFSLEAIRRFNLDSSKGLMFAVDDNAAKDEFFALIAPKATPGALPIKKMGVYYNVKSPNTFNVLGYNYQEEPYIFNIEEISHEGQSFLKFTRRAPIGNGYKSK